MSIWPWVALFSSEGSLDVGKDLATLRTFFLAGSFSLSLELIWSALVGGSEEDGGALGKAA